MNREVWKDIPDFEKLYMVSNKGRVMSVNRYVRARSGKTRLAKGRVLSCSTRSGYYYASLWKNNKSTTFAVHRLVACVFNNTPLDTKLVPDHLDFNKKNNNLCNLELVTARENNLRSRAKYGHQGGTKSKHGFPKGINFGFVKRDGKWQGNAIIENKKYMIAWSSSKKEAIDSTKRFIKEWYGNG